LAFQASLCGSPDSNSLKSEREYATFPRIGGDGQVAVVHVEDLAGEAEADTTAFWFGAEKRDKDAIQVHGIDTGAIVDDLKQYLVVWVEKTAQADPGVSRSGEGFDGVLDQVDQHLFDLLWIGLDG